MHNLVLYTQIKIRIRTVGHWILNHKSDFIYHFNKIIDQMLGECSSIVNLGRECVFSDTCTPPLKIHTWSELLILNILTGWKWSVMIGSKQYNQVSILLKLTKVVDCTPQIQKFRLSYLKSLTRNHFQTYVATFAYKNP